MNSRRSYLETLNAGRQRRPLSSLDQLNRSLENLEQRLQRPYEEPREQQAAPGRERGEERNARSEDDAALRARMVREIERAQAHEQGVSVAGRVVGEIQGLREDFQSHDDRQRRQADRLYDGFDALRRDIAAAPKLDGELNAEFERLSAAIAALSERSDDKNVTLLRLELEQVKKALEQLAREDSVQAVATRWNSFEERLGGFEAKLAEHPAPAADKAVLEGIDRRVEGLGRAIAALPTNQTINGFQDDLRALASLMDRFARSREEMPPAALRSVEDKLDELSQAVARSAASAAAARPAPMDPAPFERIEARLSQVSRQVEARTEAPALRNVEDKLDELSKAVARSAAAARPAPMDPAPLERIEARLSEVSRRVEAQTEAIGAKEPSDAIMTRLTQLSERVDELALKANLPAKAVDQLAHQVAIIADKLDRMGEVPDPDFVFKGIESRFEALAAMLERRQGDAAERAGLLFRDLERRLDEVVERLDAQPPRDPAEQSRAIASALDARFEDFARRFETRTAAQADDGKLVKSLEEQIKVLSEHLNRPQAPLPAVEAIAPRLEGIERSLADQHERVVQAAREAAEEAVRHFAGSNADRDTVAGLAGDLKALESLTRRSDERNSKTFEAIHDTLIKIVDRLGALEPGETMPAPEPAQPRKIAIAEAPPLDLDGPLPLEAPAAKAKRGKGGERTPAEAASEAALEAVGAAPEAPRLKRSVLGSLSRVLKRRDVTPAAAPETPPLFVSAPPLDLDEPLDAKAANRPLEPGSGGPDLSAIMRRVRDERAQGPRGGEADVAKSDFIAAARRAAQAAAAEAEVIKRQSGSGQPAERTGFGKLLKRKAVLMAIAAIMIALAGFQAAKPFFVSTSTAVAEDEGTGLPEEAVGTVEEAAMLPSPAEPAAAETVAATGPVPADLEGVEEPAAQTEATAPEAAPSPARAGAASSGEIATPPSAAPAPVAASAAMDVPAGIEPAALREAAAAGDAKALWEVATRLADGKGVPADPKAAAAWFEAAAALGLAPAQYRIGSIYEKGTGVERDIAKAKSWYGKAAAAGNASAMHNLAVLYAMGADGVTDNESAVRWFTAAADHGIKDSQFNLGILAAKGVGMGQDLEESYKWFAVVAKTGDKDASAKRDEVAKAMKPEALKRARATADLWKAKAVDAEANTVEIPDSWAAPAAANPSTAGIDMKEAVRTVQLILQKNGYEAGGTDGVLGAKTRAAIIAFQKDNDLPPSGEVDTSFVKALLARK